ncbi:MAG: hypothetical protein OXH86_00605 [Acidimicrobiaceae bacterium]|nr:hypothetical protein [Acidimicrobiaceae bacterium]MDE0495828.1 hypothetical protein [Acidimicrobiaceae bacterium]
MSEQDRSRLYAWLREQADETIAEYMMSCLPPAPLSDLVTKQHLEAVLSAEFSGFALTMAAQRESDRADQAAQREADRAEQAAQRESDREQSARQFRWLVGTFIALTGVLVAAMYGAVAVA